ncbi:hypothetical protein RDV78_09080 [Bacillota bacterium LX-D]|nr:hypothetical protein [Bacillota bacterium LX-D]
MPHKIIYFKDEDMPVLEEAEKQFPGQLSDIIVDALRHYLEQKKAAADQWEEITLKIGDVSLGEKEINWKKIKFLGKLLAKGNKLTTAAFFDTNHGVKYELYLTKKGKYLLYTRNWHEKEVERNSADYEVYDDLKNITQIPRQMLEKACRVLGEDLAETLDV